MPLITFLSQYVQIIREARKKPFPLDVKYLSYDFFLNYDKALTRFESIRPGRVKNEPTVSDLRCLKYLPNGSIMFKLKFGDEYQLLSQRPRVIELQTNPLFKPLFSSRRPITYVYEMEAFTGNQKSTRQRSTPLL